MGVDFACDFGWFFDFGLGIGFGFCVCVVWVFRLLWWGVLWVACCFCGRGFFVVWVCFRLWFGLGCLVYLLPLLCLLLRCYMWDFHLRVLIVVCYDC